jgi:hypothetical protein
MAEGNAATHEVIARSFLVATVSAARAVQVFLSPFATGLPRLALLLLGAVTAVILAGANVR